MRGNPWTLGQTNLERDLKRIRPMLGNAATQDSVPYQPPPGSCWLYCVSSQNTYGGTGACTNLDTPGGDDNTVLGFNALYYNETGDRNVIIGSDAAKGTTGNNMSWNVVIGYQAGYAMGGASTNYNVIIGYQAGYTGTSSIQETVYIGYRAGYSSTTAGYGVFLGSNAGYFNTTGSNIFVGFSCGYRNTQGTSNTAVGESALDGNQTGNSNTAVGYYACYGATNNSHTGNTAIGYNALTSITTGDYSVAVGYEAGYSMAANNASIYIGYQAGYNETTANRLYIENSNSATPLIYGEFDNDEVGINIGSSCAATLHIDQPSTTAAKPVLLVDQADVSEEFVRFIGTSADGVLTQSIVEEGDQGSETRAGWLKVYVQDDGNQLTDQAYFVPVYTLAA